MEPIRILQVIGSLNIGGSQTMIINLHKAIDRTRIQFDYICDKSDEMELRPIVESLGAKVYVLPAFNGLNLMEVVKAWDDFLINHPEYRILHSHVRSYASLYIPIAKKHGLKTIIHSHSTSNGTGFKAFGKKVLQFPLRYQADYYFACSKEAGKWLFGNRIVNSSDFFIVPNAIDSEKFSYDYQTRLKIRKELHIDNNYVIGTVGRLTKSKNQSFLLDVFAAYKKKNTSSVLLFIGDGELRRQLMEKARRLNISDDVLFVGNKENVQDYYQAMDLFTFPSLWEGLGTVAVEAQCSGLRCVVSTGVPKSVDLGLGLLTFVNVGSAEEWERSLTNQAYSRESQRLAVINRGFDIKESAKKLEQFYGSIFE